MCGTKYSTAICPAAKARKQNKNEDSYYLMTSALCSLIHLSIDEDSGNQKSAQTPFINRNFYALPREKPFTYAKFSTKKKRFCNFYSIHCPATVALYREQQVRFSFREADNQAPKQRVCPRKPRARVAAPRVTPHRGERKKSILGCLPSSNPKVSPAVLLGFPPKKKKILQTTVPTKK